MSGSGLYSNPSSKAPHIVAVPLVKLIVDRMPIRLDPKEPGSAVLPRYGFAEHRQPYIVSKPGPSPHDS